MRNWAKISRFLSIFGKKVMSKKKELRKRRRRRRRRRNERKFEIWGIIGLFGIYLYKGRVIKEGELGKRREDKRRGSICENMYMEMGYVFDAKLATIT